MIENFAFNLARLRKLKGLSQKELATKLGISSQTISNIENQVAYPTFTNLEKIADYFEATPNDLFGSKIGLDAVVLENYSKTFEQVARAAELVDDLIENERALETLWNVVGFKRVLKDVRHKNELRGVVYEVVPADVGHLKEDKIFLQKLKKFLSVTDGELKEIVDNHEWFMDGVYNYIEDLIMKETGLVLKRC